MPTVTALKPAEPSGSWQRALPVWAVLALDKSRPEWRGVYTWSESDGEGGIVVVFTIDHGIRTTRVWKD